MTKRFLLYLLVATATLCLVMYIRNPALLSKVWLWLVGLFGTIAVYTQLLWKALEAKLSAIARPTKKASAENRATTAGEPANYIASLQAAIKQQPLNDITVLSRPPGEEKVKVEAAPNIRLHDQLKIADNTVANLENKLSSLEQVNPRSADAFSGTTLHLLRYVDDGSTTLGLLYIDNRFSCYTLEDTFRTEKIEGKVKGKTRIPEGDFEIKYQKSDTKLTLKYREKAFTKGWFTYHLQLQQVPGFDGIYIHSGGDHNDTEGCILVSDGLSNTGTQKTFSNSKKTFELLYKKIAEDLDHNTPVRIRIYDEKWFTQTMISS